MANQFKKVARVVAATFAQAAPELAAVFVRSGAAQQQLQVFAGVTREQGQPLASLACQFAHALHHIGPVAGRAQVIDHHHARMLQHLVHIHIRRSRLAQPHQVRQAHGGKALGQCTCCIRQQRQCGVRRAEHHNVARRLLHAHHALTTVFNVAAWAGGEQMHGCFR